MTQVATMTDIDSLYESVVLERCGAGVSDMRMTRVGAVVLVLSKCGDS